MKKIKILQYTGAMNRGGAETLLMNIYRNIDRNKFEFHFITHSKEKSDYDEEIKLLGGKVIYLEPANIKCLSKYKKDFSLINKKFGPYDVIHSHIQLMNGLVLKEAKKNNIKIRISHAHSNGDCEKSSVFRSLYRIHSKNLIKKYSNYKLSCSYESGKYLYNYSKFKVLNNAIDLSQFNEKIKEDLREELGLNDNDILITHIGTFKEAKNHDFIIDVFNEINNKDKRYKLILVGRGNLLQDIKEKVKKLGLNEYVYFLGVRDDIPKILQATDIFFMPSKLEGLPVALVEAQSAGVNCVISTNIPKECDMGIGLINYESLSNDLNDWVNLILNLDLNYVDFMVREKAIINKGYSLKENVKFLENLYLNYMEQ